jgi:serine/threonine-protein kinase
MADTLPSQPRVIGRYTVLRELRRERYSVTYAAVDPVMNRQLVIKTVELLASGPKPSSEERKRVEQAFARQAQAAGRLQHPHIVTVFDAGLSHAMGYLVLERINGRPLHELLAGGLRPAFTQCASIAARIADALECAHAAGIAHGHLGPQHVFLQADGSPKVTGFGAWIDNGTGGDEALADTARLLPYFQNEIDDESRRRDVRAVGELLYMTLTGRAPGPDVAKVAEPAPGGGTASGPTRRARPETPSALAKIVDRVLVPTLGAAPKSAAALRDALTEFVWNERTDGVAPGTLSIPLAAPPQRALVHVATIKPSEDVAPFPDLTAAEMTAADMPAAEMTTANAPVPGRMGSDAAPRKPAATIQLTAQSGGTIPGPESAPATKPAIAPVVSALPNLEEELSVPNPVATQFAALIERMRPWATRNRIALASGGAILSISLFIGIMLGSMHHQPAPVPDLAASATDAPDPAAAGGQANKPAEPGGSVSFSIRPWGEIVIDGKATGVAPPLSKLNLPAGHHHIEVRHANAPVWQTDIDLPASGPVTIDHAFE